MTTPTPLQRRIPNALTIARLVITAVFIALLSFYRFPDHNAWVLPVATALFVIAALTDALDGYLARRWNAVSVFGRIMDPLADKVLVLGAFVMLAAIPWSGVAGWMTVVILGRELMVTTIRGVLEGQGVDFSATTSGKVKMIIQSISVPVLLGLLIWMEMIMDPSLLEYHRLAELGIEEFERFGDAFLDAGDRDNNRDRFRTVTLLHLAGEFVGFAVSMVTAWSAIPYMRRAFASFGSDRGRTDD